LCGESVGIVVDEFDEAEGSVVAESVFCFDDSGVSSGSLEDFRGDVVEEFGDGVFVVEVSEDGASVVCIVGFGFGDEGFDVFAEGFGFGCGGEDAFVLDE